MLLCLIPVIIINGFTRCLGSYAGGCVGAASRTLYDWIGPDRTFGHFEVHPNVHILLESGCLEWLGFSTCETEQFKDWTELLNQQENLEVTMFNMTANSGSLSSESMKKISPVTMQRTFSDSGTNVWMGALSLSQHMSYTVVGGESVMSQKVSIPNYANLASKTNANNVAGSYFSYGFVSNFVAFSAATLNQGLQLPSTTITHNARECWYINSFGSDPGKCTVDADCGSSGCSFNALCDPLDYGHHGIVLPSGSFFFDLYANLWAFHWAKVPWNYRKYRPEAKETFQDKYSHRLLPVQIFNMDIGTPSIYLNAGEKPMEKYPNIDMFQWKVQGWSRRTEGCDGKSTNPGLRGKDCNLYTGAPIPEAYVDVGFAMGMAAGMIFASRPSGGGVVYSERMTGLRFGYSDDWQINARVQNADFSYLYIPVYSMAVNSIVTDGDIQKRFTPAGPLSGSEGNFMAWGADLEAVMWINFILLIVSQIMILVGFFNGITCCEHLKQFDKQVPPINWL